MEQILVGGETGYILNQLLYTLSRSCEHLITRTSHSGLEGRLDIIDIGGESTRPRAEPVPEAEELSRVLPVIEGLRNKLKVPISIDTMKPAGGWRVKPVTEMWFCSKPLAA